MHEIHFYDRFEKNENIDFFPNFLLKMEETHNSNKSIENNHTKK